MRICNLSRDDDKRNYVHRKSKLIINQYQLIMVWLLTAGMKMMAFPVISLTAGISADDG
ncbi:MAG: hypothetical protein ACLVGO_05255 [[Ruminococcus] torques]|uniref:hypothetical protein n=1 Tax=[Ruminococcus] torques TaxID=33039 RepID=UPI003A12757D